MEDCKRYRWSKQSTNLLVSIWSNKTIQNQLKATCRAQPIWDSIGKYMTKKGFHVNGLQCRIKIKNMTRRFHEAVQKGKVLEVDSNFRAFLEILNGKTQASVTSPKERPAAVDSSHHSASEEHMKMLEIEVLEDDPLPEEEPTTGTSEDAAFVSMDGIDLEELITSAVQEQTEVIKQFVRDSVVSTEQFIRAESERVLRVVADEAARRRELEIRLERLLSRVEASLVPPLTYMGN